MRFRNILNKFPAPEYLDVPFSALVFSDTKIKTLNLDKRTLKPISFSEVDIEPGIIQSGVIKNEDALVESLNKVKSSLNSEFVRFIFPDEASYVFTVNVPVVEGKDASESISFVLEENVPLPLDDITFDFEVVSVKENRDSEGKRELNAKAVVIAMSFAVLESYLKVLDKVSLTPLLCVNESHSMARAVVPDEKDGASTVICVHANSVGIYITSGRLVEFSSTLAISPDDSESFTSLVVAEFNKVLNYWKNNNPEEYKNNVKGQLKCFVCGLSPVCKSVEKAMKSNTEISVSLANVWTNAFSLENYIPDISFEDSLRLGSAIGLFV